MNSSSSICIIGAASAWSPTAFGAPRSAATQRKGLPRPVMQMEELEFIIHPDGRVEERVRGVKGNNCVEVTAKINEALGEVIESKPTKEMYEQKVTVSEEQTVSEG